MPHFSKQSCKTLRLECVNEEFQHYFIVDTPPDSPTFKPKKKNLFTQNLKLY